MRARALSPLALAFTFAAPIAAAAESIPAEAALQLRIVDESGASPARCDAAFFDPASPAGYTALDALGEGRFQMPPRRLPIDVQLRLAADGCATAIFTTSTARAIDGLVDLGPLALRRGETIDLHVVDDHGAPVAGASVFLPSLGAAFPPRGPKGAARVATRLEPASLLGFTSAAGTLRIGLPAHDRAVVVVREDLAPAFAFVAPGEPKVTLHPGPPLRLLLRAPATRRLPERRVEVTFDLGGTVFTRTLPLDVESRVVLDRDRPLAISVQPRGFAAARRDLPGIPAEPVAIDLEPIALQWSAIEAVDVVTKQPLPIAELRLGRARAHDPDRIDFVPDWNCLAQVDGLTAIAASPAQSVDLLVSAASHEELLLRGQKLAGTEESPGTLRVELRGALPVGGRVLDAATGLPIPGAQVLVRKQSRDLDDLPLAWKRNGTVGLLAALVTDGAGRFQLDAPAWEDIVVEAQAAGCAAGSTAKVPRARAHDVELRLAPGVSLAGKVRFDAPAPAAAAAAAAMDPPAVLLVDGARHFTLRSEVDEAGAFRFPHVAPGAWRILCVRDDRSLLCGRFGSLGLALHDEVFGSDEAATGTAIEVDRARDDLEVAFVPAPPLPCFPALRVAREGAPEVARAVLARLDRGVGPRSVVHADLGGRDELALPEVASGRYLLAALDARDRPVFTAAVEIAPGMDPLAIDARPATLEVVLEGEGARAVTARNALLDGDGARLAQIAAPGGPLGAKLEPARRRWRVETLCPGEWTIESDGEPPRTVTLAPGASATITLGR